MKNLDPQQFPLQEKSLTPVITRVAAGNAILFLGSGFSRNAINFSNGTFPNAKDLAESIGALGEFDSEGDLKYASEKFIRDNDGQILVNHLIDLFSVKEVLPHQVSICKSPWRRIYTTNYDLSAEAASRKSGRAFHSVDLDDAPGDFLAHKEICVHLNGSIRNLTPDKLNDRFKLSSSSYLSADSFLSSNWNLPFRRDLEMCSAIIFVGYSLYDIEIQKILFENHDFAKKTCFITAPGITARERFTLEPFGECFPIGAEGFAEKLDELLPELTFDADENATTSVLSYELSGKIQGARDDDVDRFLMYGDVEDIVLDTAILTSEGAPIVIRRQALEAAIASISGGKHIAVVADFGNGKSVFLRSLRTAIVQRGWMAYTVENLDIYNREDLETITKSLRKSFIFIDSYEQHIDFIEHFNDLRPSNITLILAARTPHHERLRHRLSELAIDYDEIGIDELNLDEIQSFVDIVDNVGFWGDKAGLSNDAKVNLIRSRHSSQLSSGLLSILQAPQMVSRVSEILKSLFLKNSVRDTVFSICVLSTLDLPLTSSNISEIAGNDEIYSSGLRSNNNFQLMFKVTGATVTAKSSLFALALIRHNFPPVYIVDQVLKIVTALSGNRKTDTHEHELLKSLLRFSVIERFLPEKQRINNLVRFYEQVKRRVPWLKEDPHYWLQYAMAQLAYENHEKTQRYLDQAYIMAEKRKGYHTVHIDMQQARLFLKMSSSESDPSESLKLFNKGVTFLLKVPNDLHKFRLAERVTEVYASSFESYTPAQRGEFAKRCGAILNELQRFLNSGQAVDKGVRTLETIYENLKGFVKTASSRT